MKRRISLSVCLIVFVVCQLFAGGSSETNSNEKSVAVMFGVGGLGDQSFNDNINTAVLAAQEKFGFKYDYVEPSSVSEFETFIRELAQMREYDIIIIAGSDAADALNKVAPSFPDQHFVQIDSDSDLDNVIGVTFRDNESTFLGGYVAALASETGKIGVIGAMDVDVINGFIAGWEAGAKYAMPDIDIYRMYCGAFNDPVTAMEMAIQMYNRGADIILGCAGSSGLGIFQAAESSGNYAVGCDSNQNTVSPNHIMMSCIRKFGPVIDLILTNEFNGQFEGGLLNVGISEDAVDCTFELSNVFVDQSIKEALEVVKSDIKNGLVSVPSSL